MPPAVPLSHPAILIPNYMKTDLSLQSLAKLRAKADLAAAFVNAAGSGATEKQKANAAWLAAEVKRIRPLVIKANAHRFPADVVAAWLADCAK